MALQLNPLRAALKLESKQGRDYPQWKDSRRTRACYFFKVVHHVHCLFQTDVNGSVWTQPIQKTVGTGRDSRDSRDSPPLLACSRPNFFGTIRDSRDNLFQAVLCRPIAKPETAAKRSHAAVQGLARLCGWLAAVVPASDTAASSILSCMGFAKCRARFISAATFPACCG